MLQYSKEQINVSKVDLIFYIRSEYCFSRDGPGNVQERKFLWYLLLNRQNNWVRCWSIKHPSSDLGKKLKLIFEGSHTIAFEYTVLKKGFGVSWEDSTVAVYLEGIFAAECQEAFFLN